MVFSSPIFLFLFFPITFGMYYIIDKKFKNIWLLICSLVFYAWSGLGYFFLLMFLAIINYIMAFYLEKGSKVCLIINLAINLGVLGFFKYSLFLAENLLRFVPNYTVENIPILNNIVLPIGISFFTFQIMSYSIDVYWGKVKAQRKFHHLLLYIFLFPQLIAGPIVRYIDVATEIENRQVHFGDYYNGFSRFVAGLGKKVLIADILGKCVSEVFACGTGAAVSWTGMILYSLQLYYDFCGYSDMAIGMGEMFGFHFGENFNNPYQSLSIREFWRRWHMSLSGWFRDYVYIPLGGSRKGLINTIKNNIIIFALTGLWHGAAWNFLIWGLWHGMWIIVERLGFDKFLKKMPCIIQRIYTLVVVGIGWLMFRTDHFFSNCKDIRYLFALGDNNWERVLISFSPFVCIVLLVSILLIIFYNKKFNSYVKNIILIIIFIISMAEIGASDYSPFLYFRF